MLHINEFSSMQLLCTRCVVAHQPITIFFPYPSSFHPSASLLYALYPRITLSKIFLIFFLNIILLLSRSDICHHMTFCMGHHLTVYYSSIHIQLPSTIFRDECGVQNLCKTGKKKKRKETSESIMRAKKNYIIYAHVLKGFYYGEILRFAFLKKMTLENAYTCMRSRHKEYLILHIVDSVRWKTWLDKSILSTPHRIILLNTFSAT